MKKIIAAETDEENNCCGPAYHCTAVWFANWIKSKYRSARFCVILLSMYVRPDMTSAVDWVVKATYLSISTYRPSLSNPFSFKGCRHHIEIALRIT